MTQLTEKNLSLWAVFFHNCYLWEFLHLPLTPLGEASVWDVRVDEMNWNMLHSRWRFPGGEGVAGQPGSGRNCWLGRCELLCPEPHGTARLSTFPVSVRNLFFPTALFWSGLENSFNIHIQVCVHNLETNVCVSPLSADFSFFFFVFTEVMQDFQSTG